MIGTIAILPSQGELQYVLQYVLTAHNLGGEN
jgi:hypothetical protein